MNVIQLLKPNKLSFYKKCGINFLLGALSVLSLEPTNLYVILFFTIPIYIFNFDSLYDEKKLYSKKKFLIKCLFFGMSYGYGFYFFSLYWINISLFNELEVYYLFLLPSLILVPLVLSFFYGLSTILLSFFYPKNITRIFIVSLAWSISEFLRITITDFPWAQIGHSLIQINPLLQSVSLFGELFLTTFSIIIFSLPLILFFEKSHALKLPSVLIISFITLVLMIFGLSRPETFANSEKNIEVNIIQPNIKQKDKWDKKLIQHNTDKLISATIQIAKKSKDENTEKRYFIWPETATPFLIDENLQAISRLTNIFSPNDYLMLGSLRRDSNEIEGQQLYNSFFIINNESQVLGRYDKNKLVPFGEYLPFSYLFSRLNFINFEVLAGNFSNGHGGIVSSHDGLILPHVLICYEIIFTKFLHSYNQQTNLILNITNDAWFGRSSGPYQHFSMSVLRAAERGVPVVRVANTGISGVVDSFGKIIVKSQLNTEYYNKTILPKKTNTTFYTKYGYKPLFSIFLLCFLLIYYYNKRLISKNINR